MLIGYMRVSSEHDRQTTDLQHDALIDAGVDPRHLFADKASGARNDRPGLQHALAYMRPGDCLVVWKLDRLGRSLPGSRGLTVPAAFLGYRRCIPRGVETQRMTHQPVVRLETIDVRHLLLIYPPLDQGYLCKQGQHHRRCWDCS